jgi:hypothetical protein
MLLSFFAGISLAAEKNAQRSENFAGIDYRNGLLRVSVENQKFHKVMDEVSKKTGIKIVINDTTDQELTIDFNYLPLEKGLKRLLKGSNYVLFYQSEESVDFGQSSRLVKVLIFPESGRGSMAGLGELAEDRPADRAKQKGAMKEILNPDLERLKEVLKHFPQKGVDLEAQDYKALEKIKGMELLGLSHGEDGPINEINKALERLQIGTSGTKSVGGGAEQNLGVEASDGLVKEILEKIGSMNPK